MNESSQKQFRDDIKTVFIDKLKEDNQFCRELYSALTNTEWFHDDFRIPATFSFREAGGFIADLIDDGNYMDWYCSAPEGRVSKEISSCMKQLDWTHKSM